MKKKEHNQGSELKNIILGGQDGLVNVLALVLGVAAATNSTRVVLIAGLAGTFAESISMGAVAYTSSKAARDYYLRLIGEEKKDIKKGRAKKGVREIFYKKGFRGKILESIVRKITSSKKILLDTLLAEELLVSPEEYRHPLRNATVVFAATLIGSFIPLIAFFFQPVQTAITTSLLVCAIVLFATGAYKAKVTIGHWFKSGLELMLIGIGAAIVGYFIGKGLGAI